MPLFCSRLIFILFIISGFCGLLYQVVWIRLAYASFGVITPVLSIVISVFMLGLSLGSWVGGKWIARLRIKLKISSIFLYAIAELLIGVGAISVPILFYVGEIVLLPAGAMNSFNYLIYSALIITIAILPWCVFMGFTFPFMVAFIKEIDRRNITSFSYLYFANAIGAMLGTLTTALILIEILGFYHTLLIAGSLNLCIAIISLILGFLVPIDTTQKSRSFIYNQGHFTESANITKRRWICVILFLTGFISMAMEIIWIRSFTPILRTHTYSFASVVAVYLFSTWIGSYIYRKQVKHKMVLSTPKLFGSLSIFALLPIVMNDPRLGIGIPTVLISIFPFCACLGYLTPKLIDQYSSGHPYGVGMAYALNVFGCIMGPLCASYIFLPLLGSKMSLMVLSATFLIAMLIKYKHSVFKENWGVLLAVVALFLFFRAGFINVNHEELYARFKGSQIRRDHTATVVSFGNGLEKQLLVNGIGITKLTPITKFMAHLPLGFLQDEPSSALVICM